MTQLMLTGAGGLILAALLSAIVMIANAPAESHPVLTPVLGETVEQVHPIPSSAVGRVMLTFEPASQAVDRI